MALVVQTIRGVLTFAESSRSPEQSPSGIEERDAGKCGIGNARRTKPPQVGEECARQQEQLQDASSAAMPVRLDRKKSPPPIGKDEK
jgi:hypothetical protein